MATQRVRAIVESDGRLRLIDPLPLVTGQTLDLTVQPAEVDERETVRRILADRILPRDPNLSLMTDAEAEAASVALYAALEGRQFNASDLIIEERRDDR